MTSTPTLEGGFPALVLRVTHAAATERAKLEEALGQVNAILFNRVGIIAPRIEVQAADGSEQPPAVLDLDGRVLGAVDLSDAANSAATLLLKDAAQLVVPGLVEYYLCKLQTRMPALISAVRAQFPLPDLVEALRTQVGRGKSIRDLSGVLNEMLFVSTFAPANMQMTEKPPESR
jgi:type III secretory pathway component EscV